MSKQKKQFLIIAPIIILSSVFGLFPLKGSFRLVGVVAITIYGLSQYSKSIFDKALFTMFFGLCLSMLSCQLFRGQSILTSIVAVGNYWSIGIYYYFMRKEFKVNDIYSALLLLGKIVVVMYLVEYVLLQLGIPLNSKHAEIDDTEMARMRIHCSAAIFFVYFRYLQVFLKNSTKEALGWIISVAIVALLMNFRSIIAGLAIFTIIQMWLQHAPIKKIIYSCLAAVLIGGAMLSTDLMSNKLNQMMKRQNNQTLSNKNYARVTSFIYYTTKHHKNNTERVLGSGVPYGSSKYGEYMASLSQDAGIFYQDWGIIGLSWIIGIISVFGILWYVYLAARSNIHNPCLIVWLLFLVTVSLMTFEIARNGNFMVQALALACIAKRVNIRDNKKLRKKRKQKNVRRQM